MSNISESIRESALSWPIGFIGNVESQILDGFLSHWAPRLNDLLFYQETTARTFMLLVAEALE